MFQERRFNHVNHLKEISIDMLFLCYGHVTYSFWLTDWLLSVFVCLPLGDQINFLNLWIFNSLVKVILLYFFVCLCRFAEGFVLSYLEATGCLNVRHKFLKNCVCHHSLMEYLRSFWHITYDEFFIDKHISEYNDYHYTLSEYINISNNSKRVKNSYKYLHY